MSVYSKPFCHQVLCKAIEVCAFIDNYDFSYIVIWIIIYCYIRFISGKINEHIKAYGDINSQ